jgi:hypothetical protein
MTKLLALAFAVFVSSPAAAQVLADSFCPHEDGNPDSEHLVTQVPNLGPFGNYRALVVLVRFRDDTVDDTVNFTGWPVSAVAAPAFAYGLVDTSSNPAAFGDSSLTRYFYDQSLQPNGQALTFYGDVYPEVIETDLDEADYYNVDLRQCAAAASTCPPQPRGFGHLTAEVLDRIDLAGFDFSQYDQGGPNGVPDGVIDYLYIMVRGTPYATGRLFSYNWDCFANPDDDDNPNPTHQLCGSLVKHSGVSHLSGSSGSIADTGNWGPGGTPPFTYDGKQVNRTLGTYAFVRTLLIPQLDIVGLASHEVGHDIWSDLFNHLAPVTLNEVPANEPPNPLTRQRLYGYNLMGGVPYMTRGVGGLITASAHERRVRGWLQPPTLSTDSLGLHLGDLYTTGEVYRFVLSSTRSIYLSNHQRQSYFDQRHVSYCYNTCPDGPVTLIEGGLATTGLLASVENGPAQLDALPADNTLAAGNFAPYQGDLYGPGTRTQITPWTHPNINGCNGYGTAEDAFCSGSSFTMSWAAVDAIRYVPNDPDSTMAFDFYADFRDPGAGTDIAIRAHSWMDGPEMDGQTLVRRVRVKAGAILRVSGDVTFQRGLLVESGGRVLFRAAADVLFRQDLVVQAGGEVEFAPGSTARFKEGQIADVSGTFTAEGAAFSAINPSQGWDGFTFRAGSAGSLVGSTVSDVTGSTALAAITTIDASPHIEDTTIDVPAGSAAFGVYSTTSSNWRGARISDSVIISGSGTALYAAGGAHLSAYNTEVQQQDTSYAVIATGQNSLVVFEPEPAPYVGNNQVSGGGLLAYGSATVRAGESATLTSQNHFCDEDASELFAKAGGTIYARYNYWYGGAAPTITTIGGTVYYSNNLGAASCTSSLVASGANAALRGGSGGGVNESGEGGIDAPQLFEALARWSEGDYDGARLLLTGVVTEGGDAARTAINELALLHAEHPLPEIPLFLEGVAGGEGPHQTAAWGALAAVYARDGRPADAVGLLDGVAEGAPGTSEAFLARLAAFHVLLGTGEVAPAAEALARAEPATEEDVRALSVARRLLALVERDSTGTEEAFAPLHASQGHSDVRPAVLALLAARPNPFTRATEIPLALPSPAAVDVAVYDALGRRVAVLSSGRLEAGEHALALDGSALAPGVYVVRAVVTPEGGATRVLTQRLTLVR